MLLSSPRSYSSSSLTALFRCVRMPSWVGGYNPAATIFTASDGGGYWIVSANGSVITEGDALYEGGANNLHLNGSIVAGSGW